MSGTVNLTDSDISELLRQLRKRSEAFKQWDVNLAEGKEAENNFRSLLGGDSTVEIKRDFACGKTGNIAVELSCRGEMSGITTSTADWWAYWLSGEGYNDEIIVVMKRERLQEVIKSDTLKNVWGGDGGQSQLTLVPLARLFKPISKE